MTSTADNAQEPDRKPFALSWEGVRQRTLLVHATKPHSTRTVRLLAPLAADLAEWRLAAVRARTLFSFPVARRIQGVSMGTNGAALTNFDPIADAIALLEAANTTATARRHAAPHVRRNEEAQGHNRRSARGREPGRRLPLHLVWGAGPRIGPAIDHGDSRHGYDRKLDLCLQRE